jgi:hypothetical protein
MTIPAAALPGGAGLAGWVQPSPQYARTVQTSEEVVAARPHRLGVHPSVMHPRELPLNIWIPTPKYSRYLVPPDS